MGDLEKIGLLKMDFLGLRTLTLLQNAVRLIEASHGVHVDLQQLPLDDAKTYALLQRGDAKGIFQFESDGIRELLKRLKPDNIRDLIACNALYRPGPLGGGMVDAYVNRKHGREKPQYVHPVLAEILAETHGIMTYQEQIMRILNCLGGIELSSAYACIKAISKKKQEIIDQRRSDFLKGAQERGVDPETAQAIFEQILYFGGYGFTKSHSAAYALLGYRSAYLKANYPAEFMAALLSSEIDDGNKRDILVQHIEDARRLGVDVLPPDINAGEALFTVGNARILFGLMAIKGVGRGAAEEIVRARRAGGPYRDLFDFCERVDHRIVSRAAIERLIKAGALDSISPRRAALMQVLASALQSAAELQTDRRHGQMNFFEAGENGSANSPTGSPSGLRLPDVPDWPDSEKLKNEKEALDFYITSHPLAQYEEVLSSFSTHALSRIGELGTNQEVVIGGMLTLVRFQHTKKGRNANTRYARFKLEDLTAAVECVLWPDDFVRFKDDVKEDHICFVKGVIDRTREEPGLIVSRILSIEQAQRELTKGLVVSLTLNIHGPDHLDHIARVLRRTPGACPVFLHVRDTAGKRALLKVSDDFRIDPQRLASQELETILGPGRVRFSGPANGFKNAGNGSK
jgi:DNA polymerase-3 subunit alpha